MASNSIIVAIDFGTTYTGVAHSDPNDSRPDAEPLIFNNWKEAEEQDKIPTIIRYDTEGGTVRFGNFKWGAQIRESDRCHKWFKLGLEPGYLSAGSDRVVDMSRDYPDREHDHETGYHRTSARLTTDFLSAVREHVEGTFRDVYRTESGAKPRLRWILTVPAVWTSSAKNQTRDCARDAGLGEEVLLTSEPEAAFIYAAKNLHARHKRKGNYVTVLDAGGGTVDLVTYRIRQVHPSLKVEETLVPNGGKCGSVFVNRVFEKLIDDKLQSVSPRLELEPANRRHMMNHFETFIKRRFNGRDTEENVPVPGLPDSARLKIRGGNIEISTIEMTKVLDEVIDKIIGLVKDQVKGVKDLGGEVSVIILVGGFAGSPYLKSRLKEDSQLRAIDQVRCNHPDTAIARGAVIKAQQESDPRRRTILSRKSVCSLGIANSVPFKEGHHPDSLMYHDKVQDEYLCKDVMSYFVRINDDLTEETPVLFSQERLIPLGGSFKFSDPVYETYESEPSEYLNETCRLLGSLSSDLSSVPEYLYDRVGEGDFYKVRYTIKATFSDVDVKVQLDFNGMNYGSVELTCGNSPLYRPVKRD